VRCFKPYGPGSGNPASAPTDVGKIPAWEAAGTGDGHLLQPQDHRAEPSLQDLFLSAPCPADGKNGFAWPARAKTLAWREISD